MIPCGTRSRHTWMSRMLPTSGGICHVLVRTACVQLRRTTRTNIVCRVSLTLTGGKSCSIADWSDTSFILFVRSKYRCFLLLISELIQLPTVDGENLYQLALMVREVRILEAGQRVLDKHAREYTSSIADSYFASQMTCPLLKP
jgi:hypothetical protein